MAASKIRPFAIRVSDAALKDLKERLMKARFPEEGQSSGWSYGVSLSFMKQLTMYWLREYKWRKHEEYLNSFAQFTAKVDGTQIHFIHVKSRKTDAPALILTHGWPDSFYRFHKVIPMLSKEFDVVVPSLPGFGFSDQVAMSTSAVANLWATLMTNVLGYRSFFAAGGDVGSLVTKQLALKHGDLLKGVHLTDVGYPTGQEDQSTMTPTEKQFSGFVQQWWMAEGAYAMVHNTKPQSIAVGLNDSPIGLAAWMVSMINTGAEKNNVAKAFGTKEDLVTNIMIYWLTQTADSSMRSYAEEAKAMRMQAEQPSAPSRVPAAIAVYPRDAQFPREWAERSVNVKRFRNMPRGGHFAALEVPQLYAEDLIEAFDEITSPAAEAPTLGAWTRSSVEDSSARREQYTRHS